MHSRVFFFELLLCLIFPFLLISFVCMIYEALTMAQPVKSPAADTEAPTDWVRYIDLQTLEKSNE